MRELRPVPFAAHLRRLLPEMREHGKCYDIPERSWWRPDPSAPRSLAASVHGMPIATPVGPAAGPHTQMAQNIVMAYVTGARFFELKTVQIMDRLEIPRPCIDVRNIGFNAEWSQELRIEESLHEYCAAAYLVNIVRGENLMGCENPPTPDQDPLVWDVSLGYDLAGIQSNRMRWFVDKMKDATEIFDRLDAEIPPGLAHLKKYRPAPRLANSITLSTFHGCPKDEIERICVYLLEEVGWHTIVKMNPVMLGREETEDLLRDRLGYKHLRTNPDAYSAGLQFDESLELMDRLRTVANNVGLRVSAKFSNTLEVINDEGVLPPSERVIYLSGAPLHVISTTLASKWYDAAGWDAPLSFSAGVDARNVVELAAAGIAPITTCTDLLKPGGYGRLSAYLAEIDKKMEEVGAATLDELVQETSADPGPGAAAANLRRYAAALLGDDRYSHERNSREPKKIKSHLELFDCINCDKCIPACPNDAMFSYEVEPVEVPLFDITDGKSGVSASTNGTYQITKEHQLANFADWCNECSNCMTYCPEHGGPHIEKPRLFGDLALFLSTGQDGFYIASPDHVVGRIDGYEYELAMPPGSGHAQLRAADFIVWFDTETHEPVDAQRVRPRDGEPAELNTMPYAVLRSVLAGIGQAGTPNPVNSLLGGR